MNLYNVGLIRVGGFKFSQRIEAEDADAAIRMARAVAEHKYGIESIYPGSIVQRSGQLEDAHFAKMFGEFE